MTRLAKKMRPTRKKAKLTRLKFPVPPVRKLVMVREDGEEMSKLVAGLSTSVILFWASSMALL